MGICSPHRIGPLQSLRLQWWAQQKICGGETGWEVLAPPGGPGTWGGEGVQLKRWHQDLPASLSTAPLGLLCGVHCHILSKHLTRAPSPAVLQQGGAGFQAAWNGAVQPQDWSGSPAVTHMAPLGDHCHCSGDQDGRPSQFVTHSPRREVTTAQGVQPPYPVFDGLKWLLRT